jgi:hypothetical protein
MRSAAELELLRRITAKLEMRLETDRPRLEAMVRAQHAGDERMTELALEELEAQIANLPEIVLDELLAEPLKKERLH